MANVLTRLATCVLLKPVNAATYSKVTAVRLIRSELSPMLNNIRTQLIVATSTVMPVTNSEMLQAQPARQPLVPLKAHLVQLFTLLAP